MRPLMSYTDKELSYSDYLADRREMQLIYDQEELATWADISDDLDDLFEAVPVACDDLCGCCEVGAQTPTLFMQGLVAFAGLALVLGPIYAVCIILYIQNH